MGGGLINKNKIIYNENFLNNKNRPNKKLIYKKFLEKLLINQKNYIFSPLKSHQN